MRPEVKGGRFQFYDAFIDETHIYFSDKNFNGLFRVEKGKTEAEFLGHFPGEFLWQKNLHSRVFGVGEKLYFVPYDGKGIGIFHKKNQEFSFVGMEEKGETPITNAFVIKNDILMIPLELETPFFIFHMGTDTCEVAMDLWKDVCSQLSHRKNVYFAIYAACAEEGTLYLTVRDSNMILGVHLEDWHVTLYELPSKYRFRNMYAEGDDCYFTLREECKIVRWKLSTNVCQEYVIPEKVEGSPPYRSIVRWNGHLLLFPEQARKIWEFNEEENMWKMKPEYIPRDFRRIEKRKSLFLRYQCRDRELYLLPYAGNGLVLLSERGSELFEFCYSRTVMKMVEEIQNKYFIYQLENGNVLEETGSDLEHIWKEGLCDRSGRKIVAYKNTGKEIWDGCK